MPSITCLSTLRPRLFGLCLSLSLSSLATQAAVAAPSPLDLFILDAPPLTFVDSSNGHGIVGEIAVQAIAKAGYTVHIQALPWARSQRHVSEKQDLLIAPLTRTPERENRFTWIAPIISMDRAFFTLGKPVTSYEEARQTYGIIGVGLGSAQEEILRSQGFSNDQIYPLTIGDNPAQMLLKGRIDAWFNGVPESRYIWPKNSDRTLFMSPVLNTADIYLACSRQCSDELVKNLRTAVESLRADGTLERLKNQYMPE
ncbi:substrate-binding periplasmic protein [Pseudomonas vanderleydeniana]|uniref:Transporter substrate-binding domain-containing protein n=1 Tax=Pseudomonas vanderleydeniana TaxID=2745495 RepID=A0A9E6TNR3_9PSED|nr:transporter substrate-binding domain-containing protein [Pseudomonas vanderleydeniana]QXI25648.1 transporter substrate-binding domain-containing protein [Pseudomonas vanderleydeniana]